MAIVTISRQFGAGGSSVATAVAAALGVEVVDKFLLVEVARRLGGPVSAVEAKSEHAGSFLDTLARSLGSLEPALGAGWMPPFPDPLYDPRQEVIDLTTRVIIEIAAGDNAVIVGRGASFVLRDRPKLLRVFLWAPRPVRLAVLAARYGWETSEAEHRLRQTDSNRAAYIRQLYHADWQDPENYDLVLNTARLGYPKCAELILSAIGDQSN